MLEPIEVEFVNRDEQLQRLRDMCAGRRAARILLIKGPEGIGKSWILRRVQREHRDLPTALLDLSLQHGQDPIELVRGLRTPIAGTDWTAVDEILGQADTSYTVAFQGYEPVRLLELITGYFGLDDLRTMCFNLKIDFDDLGGEGKTGKSRELILYMSRRPHGLSKLVDEIRRERPDVPWDGVTATDPGNAINLPGADDKRAKELQLQMLAGALVASLRPFAPGKPAVLLLDAYEKCTRTVWEWLLQYLLPSIRQGDLIGVLVVIAGREVPQFDRDWRIVVDATELSGLPPLAIRDYWVVRRAQPETDLAFAMKYSAGIPLKLAQMADIGAQSSQKSLGP